MKINIDLSNTELTAALNNFQRTAQDMADLRAVNLRQSNELFAKRNVEDELKYTKEDLEYTRTQLRNVTDDLHKAKSSTLPGLRLPGDPPNKTIHQVADMLAIVGNSVNDTNALFVASLLAMAKRNEKIAMIKLVREMCGCGLKEAKDLVEALAFNERLAHCDYGYSPEVSEVIAAHQKAGAK